MIADELRALAKDTSVAHGYAFRRNLDDLADRVAELESRLCPHVVTTGTTSHCTLAERDARDAARYRWLKKHYGGEYDTFMGRKAYSWIGGIEFQYKTVDEAIDAAIKEQASEQ